MNGRVVGGSPLAAYNLYADLRISSTERRREMNSARRAPRVQGISGIACSEEMIVAVIKRLFDMLLCILWLFLVRSCCSAGSLEVADQ